MQNILLLLSHLKTYLFNTHTSHQAVTLTVPHQASAYGMMEGVEFP